MAWNLSSAYHDAKIISDLEETYPNVDFHLLGISYNTSQHIESGPSTYFVVEGHLQKARSLHAPANFDVLFSVDWVARYIEEFTGIEGYLPDMVAVFRFESGAYGLLLHCASFRERGVRTLIACEAEADKAPPTLDPEVAKSVVELGRLILQFSRVERATFHEDGIRQERDSDHTVMLAIIACAFAAACDMGLDLGLVSQYATVHDLVEVYADDTQSFGISAKAKYAKELREQEALERIEREFGQVFPWITDTIRKYEALADPESRFVNYMDKALPKITHILNRSVALRKLGKSILEVREVHNTQLGALSKQFPEFPECALLMRYLMDETIDKGAWDQDVQP